MYSSFCADSDEDAEWKPALAKRPRLDKLKMEATEYKPVMPQFEEGDKRSSSRNPDTREHYRYRFLLGMHRILFIRPAGYPVRAGYRISGRILDLITIFLVKYKVFF
jgi:hypothetical protein